MKNRSIAFFVYNIKYSGAAYQALALANELSLTRKIVVFNFAETSNQRTPIEITENVKVINVSVNRLWRLIQILFYSFQFDLKIWHFHGFFFKPLKIACLLHKKIIVKTTLVGDDDFDSLFNKYNAKGFLKYIKHIDINIALSQSIAKTNQKYLEADKIKRIPNGVKIMGSSFDKKMLMCCVGAICSRKRTLEVIRYFLRNYADKGFVLKIVGPLYQADGVFELEVDYINQCMSLAKDCENIEFCGLLSKPEVVEIYMQSKVMFLFSKYEGLPNVVLEAMACNCVPIVTEIGGVSREIIDDGLDGFVLRELDSPGPDARLVEQILTTNAPVEKIREKYGISIIASKYNQLYEELLQC